MRNIFFALKYVALLFSIICWILFIKIGSFYEPESKYKMWIKYSGTQMAIKFSWTFFGLALRRVYWFCRTQLDARKQSMATRASKLWQVSPNSARAALDDLVNISLACQAKTAAHRVCVHK